LERFKLYLQEQFIFQLRKQLFITYSTFSASPNNSIIAKAEKQAADTELENNKAKYLS